MAGVDYEVGIPIIDISNLWDVDKPNESHKTIISIAEACRDYGFFYVKNHGVDEQLRENVFEVLKDFFALPLDEKEKIKSKGSGSFRGYFEFQSETTAYLEDDHEPDWREGFYASVDLPDGHPCKKRYPSVAQNNKWPEEPAVFREIVEKYHKALKELGFKIMAALATGLGLKKEFFEADFIPYPVAILGMYHYLPSTGGVGPDETSCGEHTDYGVLTILMQDNVGGLEIRGENDQWIQAPPIPGTFVINLGDMLEVWTNGAYKATKHRVRKTQSGKDRLSVAFFLDPSLESEVKPIKLENSLISIKNRTLNANITIPVIYGEYVEEKFQGTFQ